MFIFQRKKPRNIWDVLGFTRQLPPPQPKREDRHFLYALKKTVEIIQHNPLSHDA
jgi:hypothetical protein